MDPFKRTDFSILTVMYCKCFFNGTEKKKHLFNYRQHLIFIAQRKDTFFIVTAAINMQIFVLIVLKL